MRNENAESRTYEQTPQTCGHVNLRRQVRCAIADVAGEGRHERSRPCRKKRRVENDYLELGVGNIQANHQRYPSKTSGSTRSERSDSYAERINTSIRQISQNTRQRGYPLLTQYPTSGKISRIKDNAVVFVSSVVTPKPILTGISCDPHETLRMRRGCAGRFF